MSNGSSHTLGETPENNQALYDELFEGVDKGQCFTPGAVSEWTGQQFGSVDLPDLRLKKRCLELVSVLAQKPQDSINQANDAWAQIKGAYRFIENDRVTPESLQTPVNETTAGLCQDRDLIIAIQDTTTLSFDSARGAEGLGPINDSAKARGMFYHPVLALEERGLPIGLLDQEIWSRKKKTRHKAKDQRPIQEKESGKWMRGVANAHIVLNRNIPEGRRPRIIHVFDREGDIQETLEFIYSLEDGAVIRSTHNRRIMTVDGRNGLSHDLVRSAPLLGDVTIDVPRKPGQKKRKATLELRSETLVLNFKRANQDPYQPVILTLLEAWEANPPENVEPLHWILWTTESVADLKDAKRILHIYVLRWKIEEFFLVLKQGCKVEKLQLETADRLAKLLSLYAAISLRILQCRDLPRLAPDLPCTTILSEDEWKVLWLKIHKIHPHKEQAPPTIKQAVLWIGRLGGHIGRKSDGMPGVKTLWRGLRDLAPMVEIYNLMRNNPLPQ